MQENYICCFTGHRRIYKKHARALPAELDKLIADLYEKGVRTFRAGGALGFDTVAALAVIRLRKQHPDVKLELCLPCKDQSKKWTLYSKMVYEKILHASNDVSYASDVYTSGCMFERNRKLVNGAHVCVAYYDGGGGGTAYTYSYAQKSQVKIINIFDGLDK